MKINTLTLFLLTGLMSVNAFAASVHTISYDNDVLEHNKAALDKNDAAYKSLIAVADKALLNPINPVTYKTLTPASGDKHDYYSFGPYWWPNPNTKDGLPYIRKDGEYNMATKTDATDKQRMISFAHDVKNLGLAYYFSSNPKYATKAKEQLHAWLIDDATRMNPNMRYAQAIPGIVDGRGIGIIDSRLFIGVMDTVELIKPQLSAKEYEDIQYWFVEFKNWMVHSRNGFEEDNWHNNHGTWYDAQLVALSLFTHDIDLAKERIEIAQMRRIGSQFDMRGQQTAELERTRPWHYINFNLEAYNLLGHFGDTLGMNVWNYEIDQHSLHNGYLFVANYVNNPTQWSYKEIKGMEPTEAYAQMVVASEHYTDPLFTSAVTTLKKDQTNASNIANLVY